MIENRTIYLLILRRTTKQIKGGVFERALFTHSSELIHVAAYIHTAASPSPIYHYASDHLYTSHHPATIPILPSPILKQASLSQGKQRAIRNSPVPCRSARITSDFPSGKQRQTASSGNSNPTDVVVPSIWAQKLNMSVALFNTLAWRSRLLKQVRYEQSFSAFVFGLLQYPAWLYMYFR